MISIGGREYGRAADLAEQLGDDVTAATVRDWARRGLIAGIHLPGRGRGETWYRLDDVLLVEMATRTSTRGRRRRACLTQ